MKLNRIEKKRMREVVATLKDNMIEDLLDTSESVVDDIVGKKRISYKAYIDIMDQVIDRLFK